MSRLVQKPAKAIIFARVSSQDQKMGNSLIAQICRMQEYCKENSLEVIYEFQLIETSTSADRAFFYNMLECIKKQEEPVALIVDGLDRLQRSFKEIPILDKLRTSSKIEIHFLRERQVLDKNSNSTHLMAYQMFILMARAYTNSISDNTKRGIQQKLQNGEWIGKAPIGYLNMRDKSGKANVVIDAEKAPIIKQIFEMRANVSGITDIAKTVNLSRNIVDAILKNSFYYGKMYVKSHDKVYPHKYESLITKELFNKCQEVKC